MSQTTSTLASPRSQIILVILIAGCAVAALSFGPRASLGLFLSPMSEANGWGRDVFALALAIQVLLWGAAPRGTLRVAPGRYASQRGEKRPRKSLSR